MRNEGITLIALVITVIVMLILAAVAISAITNPEGIFKQAQKAGENYNKSSKNEKEEIDKIIDKYLGGETVTPEQEPEQDSEPEPEPTNGTTANGTFDTIAKVNSPDTSGLPVTTTQYITWTETDGTYTEDKPSNTVPTRWYDYTNGQWANIKSTANNLEAYWVWIPRFAYKLPESSSAKKIEVIFVKNDGKEGANGETCYYATDTAITSDESGLYSKKTNDAANKWIIHPAFTFGEKQLTGIWVGKFEASSNTSTASSDNGGGDTTTSYQVQIKPLVPSWRNIQVANMFTVCENIKKTGGVIGNNSSSIDTHMIKNIEWGAVAILSQSVYGIYNPSSTNKESETVAQVWNNSNTSYLTGYAGSGKDATDEDTGKTDMYNTGNGPKASTTGTVYGVYDMAGGTFEYVMGLSTNASVPTTDSKYYDIYDYASSYTDHSKGKIGDATSELQPLKDKTWNDDSACPLYASYTVLRRGSSFTESSGPGVFAFNPYDGGAYEHNGFRAVLVAV